MVYPMQPHASEAIMKLNANDKVNHYHGQPFLYIADDRFQYN